MVDEAVTPSRQAMSEALALAEEILRNIELSEVSLAVAMLKGSRLARLLNDSDYQLAFEYEASGYPSTPNGIPRDAWKIAQLSGRVYQSKEEVKEKNRTVEKIVERANTQAIEAVEQRIAANKASLEASRDPNVSISSANPNQFVGNPLGNTIERNSLRKAITDDAAFLAGRRGFIHRYVSRRFDELRFSGIADDIFSRIRNAVDDRISNAVPRAVGKFAAIYENLTSENPEDWANAVHGCRRILQDLADVLYPPRADLIKTVNGKEKPIKLGADNYINRLIAHVEEMSDSGRYEAVVGSSLHYLGDRLDAAFTAAQKGSHSEISSREEADRYVVYTYMLVADLLSHSKAEPIPTVLPVQVDGQPQQ